MSVYGRMQQPLNGNSINDLRPESVLRHDGDVDDYQRRLHAAFHLAHRLGKPGQRKIMPYLFKYICCDKNLRLAWDHLSKRAGQTPGPDGRRYSDFNESEIWQFLRQIRDSLKDGSYRPYPQDEKVCQKSKGPGRGTRPIVLQNIEHRIVQRAVVQVLQLLLDPLFIPDVHGGRPGCGPWSALATAQCYFSEAERKVWVTEDLKDAFTRVPLPRLLQIVKKYVRNEQVVSLITRIVSNSKVKGLRQGGCLSPLLLNLYLHHLVDRPWRKQCADTPMVRFLDDLLILCQTTTEAHIARKRLQKLLKGTGMLLKPTEGSTIRRLTQKSPAVWLAFQIEKSKSSLKVSISDRGWERIKTEMASCAADDEQSLMAMLGSMLQYFAPCFTKTSVESLVDKITNMLAGTVLAESTKRKELKTVCRKLHRRWLEYRTTVQERMAVDLEEMFEQGAAQ